MMPLTRRATADCQTRGRAIARHLSPGQGHELIAAGLVMLAGPTNLDELDHWLRVGGSPGAERHPCQAGQQNISSP
jgi:hypothetical protein